MTRTPLILLALSLAACGTSPEQPEPAEAAEAPSTEAEGAAPAAEEAPEAAEAEPLPGSWPTRSPSPEAAEAFRLFEAGQADEARAQVEARILAEGADADAFFVRGRLYAADEAWDAAAADFKTAWKLDAGFHDARYWHAHALVMQRRCEAALPLYEELTVAWPHDAGVRFNHGHCLYNLKRYDDALAEVKAACSLGMERACKTAPKVEWARGKDLERRGLAGEDAAGSEGGTGPEGAAEPRPHSTAADDSSVTGGPAAPGE